MQVVGPPARGVAVVAVILAAALLAGCAGLVDQDGDPATETLTPAPVPTETAPNALAPGVTAESVDATTVAGRHERALAGTSFTLETTVRVVGANGTTRDDQRIVERRVRRVGADGAPVHVVASFSRPRGTSNQTGGALWYDGNRTSVRTEYEDGETEFLTTRSRPFDTPAMAAVVYRTFAALEVQRADRVSNGATVVAGPLTDASGLPGPALTRSAENGSTSARVDPAGYVDRLAVGYDATVRGERVRVRYELSVTAVGATTVTEPSWVERASEQGGTARTPSATPVADERHD